MGVVFRLKSLMLLLDSSLAAPQYPAESVGFKHAALLLNLFIGLFNRTISRVSDDPYNPILSDSILSRKG